MVSESIKRVLSGNLFKSPLQAEEGRNDSGRNLESATGFKHANGGKFPSHVAIIMDGNGRWAKSRSMPRVVGHKQGAEALRATIKAAVELNVRYLTVFGFSSENWSRPLEEVSELMGLLRLYLTNELNELHQNGVCVRVIGERARLDTDIQDLILEAETLTQNNQTLGLTIALSYGGQQDILQAVQKLARQAADGTISPESISLEDVAMNLLTQGIPNPDLLIRTSGEQRISNFLLWQCAYAEMYFTDVLWPDFGKADLEQAIKAFVGRERRYGSLTRQA